jgi:hypothetical protein
MPFPIGRAFFEGMKALWDTVLDTKNKALILGNGTSTHVQAPPGNRPVHPAHAQHLHSIDAT